MPNSISGEYVDHVLGQVSVGVQEPNRGWIRVADIGAAPYEPQAS